jgi:hypothetical protein
MGAAQQRQLQCLLEPYIQRKTQYEHFTRHATDPKTARIAIKRFMIVQRLSSSGHGLCAAA